MTVESPQDVAGLSRVGRIVGQTLRAMQVAVRPGVTTRELDRVAADELARPGSRSAPYLTYRFPGATCTPATDAGAVVSVNAEAAHGVPGDRVIRPGDVVKLDVSAEHGGYVADAALTVLAPPVAPRHQALYDCARAAFDAAFATARVGAPLNRLGRAAEAAARQHQSTVIADLPGHGIGRGLHESPSVPMAYDRRARGRLAEGLVITIEPHVAAGPSGRLVQSADGWTLKTRDGSYVAEHEHTIIITHGEPIVVTAG